MAERSSFDEHIGSCLAQRGITSAMLLSHDSAELTSVEVSNGVILVFYVNTHNVLFIYLENGWPS